jgi:hydrophobic/amphiphilic exporter-1 (mainly G- bacteria), HAE1 family
LRPTRSTLLHVYTFQVFIQAEGANRIDPGQIAQLRVRNSNGGMVPLGSLVTLKPASGATLVSLYNLYPSATINGVPAPGFSSGEAIDLMEQTATHILPPGTAYEWTAMSYQEKAVGGQVYFVFGLSLLLVYFVIAAQYEDWWLPLSAILAVPLALVGPVATLTLLGVTNNLYTQIGLILLIALSAKTRSSSLKSRANFDARESQFWNPPYRPLLLGFDRF